MSKYLIFGATGQLGFVIYQLLKTKGCSVTGASRHGPDVVHDLCDTKSTIALLTTLKPNVVINCAAIVALQACEDDFQRALTINSYPSDLLACYAIKFGYKYVYISTDHYYLGKDNVLHSEYDPLSCVNRYAQSKYLGEVFASQCPDHLVLRTNITGFRIYPSSSATFAEWLISSLLLRKPLSLFNDFYSSTIDVRSAAFVILFLIESNATGLYNLASSQSVSKLSFASTMAKVLDISLDWHVEASCLQLSPRRANTLGLSTVKLTSQYPSLILPSVEQVCVNLINWYRELN